MILRVFIFFLFTGYALFFTASFYGTGHANDGVSEDEDINYFKIKPAWFWNQPVNCGKTALGMTMHSELVPEQSVKLAYDKSLAVYQRQQEIIYGNREPDEEGLAGSAAVKSFCSEYLKTCSFSLHTRISPSSPSGFALF